MNNVYIPKQANIGNKSNTGGSFEMKKEALAKGYTIHKVITGCLLMTIPVAVTAVIVLALFGHKFL